jgi:hypothetical protein
MDQSGKVHLPPSPRLEPAPDLLTQYGCGPIWFSGQDDALYERHLLFDDVVDLSATPYCMQLPAALAVS